MSNPKLQEVFKLMRELEVSNQSSDEAYDEILIKVADIIKGKVDITELTVEDLKVALPYMNY